MRLLTAICVAALVVAFAVPAFAETQNVKVAGEIKAFFVYQNDIDLNSNDAEDNQNSFMQQTNVSVEADLTDNVSTYVRILNERDWNAETTSAQHFDVLLDEAYVTLREMLYAPLTVKVGRQNIWLGKGFVVGNAGALLWNNSSDLPSTIRELSEMTAFDAARATLDYDPWTVDLIYSKIDANNDEKGDDVDLYVVNVGYDFTKYDAEAEMYYILKWDRSDIDAAKDTNVINTVGIRGSLIPYDSMNLWGEVAVQFGQYRTSTRSSDREAFALDLGGDYTFADVKWVPKLGLEFVYWSGEKAEQTGDWKAWDSLYPGKFDTYIAAFRNITKITNYGIQLDGSDNGMTNELQAAVIGGLSPMTDVNIDARWTYIWFDESPVASASDDLGWELDCKVTYDYTEDVLFFASAGLFAPESFYPADQGDDNATQILSGIKVDF
ncbi:MAG: alginate export family protein [Candidatus Omnitrophica bacterium]|nr:alginate export family protein [Candidatus Omnitrophota bacterium]